MARNERSDKGNVLVTGRDQRVGTWIGQQYIARLDQFQFLLGLEAGKGAKETGRISENAARNVASRWVQKGWAVYRKILVGEPAWIWLTRYGLQDLGLSYKPYTPSIVSLKHMYAVNQVRIELEKKFPDSIWVSERDIRAKMFYQKGARLPHVPDGILQTEKGDIAIEVELTLKKPLVLLAILRELVDLYHEVWYFVSIETGEVVNAARKKLDPDQAQRIIIYSAWT